MPTIFPAAPYIQDKLRRPDRHRRQGFMVVQDLPSARSSTKATEWPARRVSQFDCVVQGRADYLTKSDHCRLLPCIRPGSTHLPAWCIKMGQKRGPFTGDTLFHADGGSPRADFPGGDAGRALRLGIQRSPVAARTILRLSCAMNLRPQMAVTIRVGEPTGRRREGQQPFMLWRQEPARTSFQVSATERDQNQWPCPRLESFPSLAEIKHCVAWGGHPGQGQDGARQC